MEIVGNQLWNAESEKKEWGLGDQEIRTSGYQEK